MLLVTFPVTHMRKSVLVVEPVVFASAINTVMMPTSRRLVYQEPVPISRFQTQLVRALLVSNPACLLFPQRDGRTTYQWCLATSLVYTDDVTFCSDGSYCCGNNNTACCNSTSGNLEFFYGNPGAIPSAPALLPGYYSNLHVSIKSRSTTISSSSSSTQAPTKASTFTSPPTGITKTTYASTYSLPATTTPTSSTSTASLFASTIDTTATASSTSSSHIEPKNAAMNKDSKLAIGIAVPAAFIAVGLTTWWLPKRQRSHMVTSSHDETLDNPIADTHVLERHPPGELPTGLDRAELVTSHWDSAALPFSHEIFEIAHRS